LIYQTKPKPLRKRAWNRRHRTKVELEPTCGHSSDGRDREAEAGRLTNCLVVVVFLTAACSTVAEQVHHVRSGHVGWKYLVMRAYAPPFGP
jgi:hypothetical protein